MNLKQDCDARNVNFHFPNSLTFGDLVSNNFNQNMKVTSDGIAF